MDLMKIAMLVVTLVLPNEGIKRVKRNVLQLGFMIDCTVLSHNFVDYNGYGCWCGIGGNGTPLDDTDSCCRDHDRCYDALHDVDGTCVLLPQLYTALYLRYSCNHCADLPAYDNWWFKMFLASAQCRRQLCQCDATLVRCLKRAEPTFNPDYRYYYKRLTDCESDPKPWINTSVWDRLARDKNTEQTGLTFKSTRNKQPPTVRLAHDKMDNDDIRRIIAADALGAKFEMDSRGNRTTLQQL